MCSTVLFPSKIFFIVHLFNSVLTSFLCFYLCLILSYGILLYAFNESSPKNLLLFVVCAVFFSSLPCFPSILFLFLFLFFQYFSLFIGILWPNFFFFQNGSFSISILYFLLSLFFLKKKKANWKSFEHQSKRKSSNRPYWYCSLLKQVRHKQFNFHKAQIRKYE